MAQRPGPGSSRTAESGAQRHLPLPGISSTASALRTRRNESRAGEHPEEMDDFEVETPGDAALNELPSGIIMPSVKSSRVSQSSSQGMTDPSKGQGGRTKTLKAGAAPLRAPRAPPPKLPGSAVIDKPGLQFKGTPARLPRYSLPVRAEKPVRASKFSGRHVLLPSESQLAPLPAPTTKGKKGMKQKTEGYTKEGDAGNGGEEEEEEDDDDDDDDEDDEDNEEVEEEDADESGHVTHGGDRAKLEHRRTHRRPQQRKNPVYYTFERMSPLTRATTPLPRLTSYAVSTSLQLQTALAFIRREHGVRPRLYEGCVYALYFKPLLPGFGRASVRSSRVPQTGSPGAESRHEREIQRDDESGYIGNYFVPQSEQDIDTDGYIPNEHREDAIQPAHHHHHHHPAQMLPSNSASEEPSDPDSASARDMLMVEEDAQDRHQMKAGTRVVRVNQASHTHEADVNEHAPQSVRDALDMAELVLLPYGVVVMFNFTQEEEELILADLMTSGAIRNPHKAYDRELFHFCYDPNVRAPRIMNDFFTFREPNHLLKLSLAHAIAQSTKLSEFEENMHNTLELTSHIPKELAQTGELRVSRRGALRMSGHLFKLRVDVNLTSDVLDTPDLFWNEASLQALYDAIRTYLEIDERAQTLNERLAVANELLEVIHEHLSNAAMSKITWIIIILIVVACIVAVGEISARLIQHAGKTVNVYRM